MEVRVLYRSGFWWRGFGHGPHVHGDGPVGLNHGFPDLREDDLAIGTDEIVVAFVDVRADDIDVKEGLLDELFHTLTCVNELSK